MPIYVQAISWPYRPIYAVHGWDRGLHLRRRPQGNIRTRLADREAGREPRICRTVKPTPHNLQVVPAASGRRRGAACTARPARQPCHLHLSMSCATVATMRHVARSVEGDAHPAWQLAPPPPSPPPITPAAGGGRRRPEGREIGCRSSAVVWSASAEEYPTPRPERYEFGSTSSRPFASARGVVREWDLTSRPGFRQRRHYTLI